MKPWLSGVACSLFCAGQMLACGLSELPAQSSSSSSSSSSGGGAGGDASGPDVVDPRCPAAFSSATSGLACDGVASQCAGSAMLDGDVLRLTSEESFVNDGQTGGYWRKLGLPRASSFTLTVDVSSRQPAGGGIQGHGFALVFVQGPAGSSDFPSLREGHPDYMGINRLGDFHGAGAYVKTYNGPAGPGVLALRTTAIPSSSDEEVDNWEGPIGNEERLSHTDDIYLRFVIEVRPDAAPTVEMLRFDDATYAHGSSIVSVELPTLDGFDYFGVTAARGNDGFSQSGGRLEAISLSCPE